MKISTRNALKGRLKKVLPGAINTEVTVALGGGGDEIVAVITRGSAERLELVPGMEVYAIVKASNVLIAID
jgi:molybdopterin-binding protein